MGGRLSTTLSPSTGRILSCSSPCSRVAVSMNLAIWSLRVPSSDIPGEKERGGGREGGRREGERGEREREGGREGGRKRGRERGRERRASELYHNDIAILSLGMLN